MSDEYVKSEQILETRWKCPSCGADNRGRDMTCPTCGAPKDESSVYVLDADAPVVEDEALIEEARGGLHWVCAYCQKQNRGPKDRCRFCNADQTIDPKAPPPLPAARKKPSVLLGCGVLLLVAVGLFALLAWYGLSLQIHARVASLSWQQSTHLHERTLMHKDGWKDQVPGDAFDSKCKREQRTTREVVDHYRTVSRTRQVRYQSGSREECHEVTENLANGYASRKTVCKNVPEYDYRDEDYTEQEAVYRTEPVYDEFCRFKLYEWPVSKTASRQGEGHAGYAFPDTSEVGQAACTPCDQKTDQLARCCSQSAVYSVTFERSKPSDDPEQQGPLVYVAPTRETYESFQVGDERVLEIEDGVVKVVEP